MFPKDERFTVNVRIPNNYEKGTNFFIYMPIDKRKLIPHYFEYRQKVVFK